MSGEQTFMKTMNGLYLKPSERRLTKYYRRIAVYTFSVIKPPRFFPGTMIYHFGFIARKVFACARLNPKLAENPAP